MCLLLGLKEVKGITTRERGRKIVIIMTVVIVYVPHALHDLLRV